MEDEALDSRGRNITLLVFGAVVLLIAGLVFNNYRVKRARIAGMLSADPARQAAKVREMMAGFTNDGHVAEQLQGERPSVRQAAVRALLALATAAGQDEETRRNAARLTVPFMKDSDQPIRDQAIQALTAMGPVIAMDAATHALGDTDNNVKAGAQKVCENFAPDSLAPILAYSGKDGAKARLRTLHRTFAGNALFEISKKNEDWKTGILFGEGAVQGDRFPPSQARSRFQAFLGSKLPVQNTRDASPDDRILGVVDYLDPARANEDDQNNAISILDRIKDVRAVPAIIPRVHSPTTRRAAVGALGRLADARATDVLLRYLPTDETNRLDIVIALGRIADPRATDPLIEHGLGSVSDTVRAAAADSLRSIGAPAMAKLIAAAGGSGAADPSFYRAEGAVRALAGLRIPAATRAAVAGLRHPSNNVREAAAESLGDSGDPAVIPALVASFTDRDGRVAGFAARSVSVFGAAAVPPLVEALADPDRVYWASKAILYVGRPAVGPLQARLRDLDRAPLGARAAATLLGDLRDARAIGTLREALARSTDPDFNFAASSSLQRLSVGRSAEAESGA